MPESIRVVVADNNADYTARLSREFMMDEDFDLVGIACDGTEACELTRLLLPDVLVMDIILPHLDGIAVIEEIKSMALEKMPRVIIASALVQEDITKQAVDAGAACYLQKPVEFHEFKAAVNEVLKSWPSIVSPESDAKAAFIKDLLYSVGVPERTKGCIYLCEAIVRISTNIDLLKNVTKQLYPSIAETYQTKPSAVERAIRHAVESAWSKGNVSTLHSWFGYTVDSNKGKPTNSEFIAMLAERTRLKYTK